MSYSTQQQRHIRKDYHWQLRQPEWFLFSLKVIAGHPFCASCASTAHLQAHHKVYKYGVMAWEYDPSELKVLCEDCHKELHQIADDCWVEMLSFNRCELELVLKALRSINKGLDGHSVVEFYRQVSSGGF